MAKKNYNYVEALDSNEVDDEGFIDGDIKGLKPLVCFNFASSAGDEMKKEAEVSKPATAKPSGSFKFHQNGPGNSQRGLTPPVDGEHYTLKRCYQFRESTIRKLNEIKAKHPDVNIYLNTIIDEAINYYYDSLKV